MDRDAKIYIAGHTGLVGSALLRKLQNEGYQNLITLTHAELDLERQTVLHRLDQRYDRAGRVRCRIEIRDPGSAHACR